MITEQRVGLSPQAMAKVADILSGWASFPVSAESTAQLETELESELFYPVMVQPFPADGSMLVRVNHVAGGFRYIWRSGGLEFVG